MSCLIFEKDETLGALSLYGAHFTAYKIVYNTNLPRLPPAPHFNLLCCQFYDAQAIQTASAAGQVR